jgi:hypothetical protein
MKSSTEAAKMSAFDFVHGDKDAYLMANIDVLSEEEEGMTN